MGKNRGVGERERFMKETSSGGSHVRLVLVLLNHEF